jgi:hypothetical protein
MQIYLLIRAINRAHTRFEAISFVNKAEISYYFQCLIKLELINEPVVCQINTWASVRNPIFCGLNRIFF